MKHLSLILVILVLGTLTGLAQPKNSVTAMNDTTMGAYLGKDAGKIQSMPQQFFTSKDIFESYLAQTVTDAVFDGRTDTSTTTGVIYGRPWSTNRLSKMPRIWLSVRDSGTVLVKYRWIALGDDNLWSAGAWAIYGGLATSVTARSSSKFQMIQIDPSATTMADSMLTNHATGYIQFRYEFTSTRTAKTGGGTRQFNYDSAKNKNYSLEGQAILNGRRAEGR